MHRANTFPQFLCLQSPWFSSSICPGSFNKVFLIFLLPGLVFIITIPSGLLSLPRVAWVTVFAYVCNYDDG